MAGEAEISFADAAGEQSTASPATTATSAQPEAGEISFADAMGPEPIKGPSFMSRVSEAAARTSQGRQQLSDIGEQARGSLFDQMVGDTTPIPHEGFGKHAGKTVLRGIRALVTSPTKAVVGGGKALASGVVGLGESAVAGIRGLGRAAGETLVKETVGRIPQGQGTIPFKDVISSAAAREPLAGAVEEINTSMEQTAQMREIASQITKVNLAAETEQDQAMEGLLMLLPEGVTAAGDTVYEKTGSALAGAGTQGILTLLTFKPQLITKVVTPKSAPKIAETVGELAKEDLPAAEAVVAHVEQSSPTAAKKMRVRLNEVTGKFEPVVLGEKAAKAEIKAVGEITPEDAGVGAADAIAELPQTAPPKPSTRPQMAVDEFSGLFEVNDGTVEFLAQESGKYLQVKRSDVVPEARGKGKAQEVMLMLLEEAEARQLTLASDVSVSKDAQRVYTALSKKGFEVKENPNTINPETGSKVSLDPRVPVYEVTRKAPETKAVTEPASIVPPVEAAKVDQIFVSGPTLDSIPGGKFIKGKMVAWWDQIIRTISPEALGPKAEKAAAATANKIAETANRDAANHGLAAQRIAFWEKMSPGDIRDFIKSFEKGKPQRDPVLQKLDKYLRDRADDIFKQDQANGIKYDPIDNYLYHIFEDGEALARHFEAKYGKRWGNPGFMKNRTFDFYEEAIAANFKPKYTNPEEIILARQHASDIAQMQVELLRDLESYGLAKEKTKAQPNPPKGNYTLRRAPNGKSYWVEADAHQILHNAFDTKSLWSAKGIGGDLFRGAMFLKNSTVPAVLSLSLFHPLHLILGMDSAATMTRLTKEMVVSGMNPVKWFGKWLEQMALGSKGIPLYGIIDNPKTGFRLLKAYQGKIDPAKLTAADRTALQYMNEGGFIPEMSVQYRSGAIDKFRKAVREVAAEFNSPGGVRRAVVGTKGAVGPLPKAGFYTPFAILDALQYPMFRLWIPALKIASYLKDVQTAIKLDPRLATDKGRRILAFRKLSKSVDNRYGEMNYQTLFWNRTIKDIAVANTLSLGWNLGFLREYGGGTIDVVKAPFKKGGFKEKVKTGQLDRPLFLMFYTTQVMLYSGLLTWALTGKPPTDLLDYLYPKSGDKDAQGKDLRLNTPFYPREFAAIAKHVEHEGVGPGLWHVVSNKSSGVLQMGNQWVTGVDWRDREIRDPNSAWHQQMRDTLAHTLEDLQPISLKQLSESKGTAKDVALSFSGFGKAPKYATQSDTEAGISTLYRKYYAPKQTPFETALISDDRRKLAKFYDEGNIEEYSNLLDEMMTKYNLTAEEQGRLARNIMKRGVDYNPYLTMFERLTWQQQKRLLDEMSEEERAVYLPRSNKQHLRYSYEEPSAAED